MLISKSESHQHRTTTGLLSSSYVRLYSVLNLMSRHAVYIREYNSSVSLDWLGISWLISVFIITIITIINIIIINIIIINIIIIIITTLHSITGNVEARILSNVVSARLQTISRIVDLNKAFLELSYSSPVAMNFPRLDDCCILSPKRYVNLMWVLLSQ